MRIFGIVLIIAICSILGCSNKPKSSTGPPVEHLNYITWDTTCGGEMHEFSMCVVADPYGGGVVAGGSGGNPLSVFDGYLVFFDKSGEYFERTYYDPPAQWVEGACRTGDGFATAGCYGYPGDNNSRAWIARFDWSGNMLWETYYAGIKAAEGYCIAETHDGNLVAGCFTFGEFVDPDSMGQHHVSGESMALFDGATGELLKEARISNDSFHVAFVDGIASYDEGVAIVGWGIILDQSFRPFFMLLDDTLGIVKQTGPAECSNAWGSDLMEVCWDGDGFIATGSVTIDETATQLVLVRFTRSGEVDWCRTFGEGMSAHGRSVAVTRNGYAVLGYISEPSLYGLPGDVYLILTDRSGNVLSEHTFGVAEATSDQGYGIDVTADGGLIISGRTFVSAFAPGDLFVIKTDPNGNVLR